MIELSQLNVKKQGKSICHVEQLSVHEGEILAVVGTNGSGKTTLMRVLAGLETDFTGKCEISVSHLQKTYLHQQPLLFRGTALSNVRYARRCAEDPSEWLQRLGVAHLADHNSRTLSGGETRRVALARALATDAKLLLLDEPLADLDPQATELVCNVLTELSDRTIIITSPTTVPEPLARKTFLLAG